MTKLKTPRIEKVRLAMMILNHVKNKPHTVEEIVAVIDTIITELKID
tara:strand:- start:852 stop:992 length:141 start_codon:yes stop_codon:yes gene_type:complete